MAVTDYTQTKQCIRCKINKLSKDFYRSAKSKDGKCSYCIICTKEKVVEWQKANPEKKAASDKKQNAKPDRISKNRIRKRKAFESDREGSLKRLSDWKKANPERNSQRVIKWAKANKEKVAAAQKRYHDKPEWRAIAALRHQVNNAIKRANELGLDSLDCINRVQWQAVIAKFKNSCCYCGIKGKLTLEHLTPLSNGGDNSLGNIAPACASCNRKKWHRSLEDFAPEKAAYIRAVASLI